jgi:hypothetical protein
MYKYNTSTPELNTTNPQPEFQFTHSEQSDTSDKKAAHSTSDLADAVNALVVASGFDGPTLAGLLAAMGAAGGRDAWFRQPDFLMGRRMARCSKVSAEYGEDSDDVSDRAHAARWARAWKLIDAEQTRTGICFVERRRGGLRETADPKFRAAKIVRRSSSYRVPLVGIVVEIVRQARARRATKRLERFADAANTVLAQLPREYKSQPPSPLHESRSEKTKPTPYTEATKLIQTIRRAVCKLHHNALELNLTEADIDKLRFELHYAIDAPFDDAPPTPPYGGAATLPVSPEVDASERIPFGVVGGGASGMYVLPDGKEGYMLNTDPERTPDAGSESLSAGVISTSAAARPEGHELFSKFNVYAGADAILCHANVYSNERENESPDMLHAALVYAREGLPVFPLHSITESGKCTCGKECGAPGKHPRTARGFLDATTDERQVQKWWTLHPSANIGIATGERSGIVAVDVDPRNGGNETLARLEAEHGALPATRTTKTGGDGKHFIYRASGNIRGKKLGDGIDFKADGGYIVAPPSNHVSGGRYEVENNAPFADLPDWIRRLVTAPPQTTDKAHRAPTSTTSWSGGRIPEGERNDTLFRYHCSPLHGTTDEIENFDLLCAMNAKFCLPPLPEYQITRIARSVTEYRMRD